MNNNNIITYTIESNSGTNTTGINFMFNAAVSGLTANDITITNGDGSATKGTLTGSGKLWQLKITVTKTGNISVKITKSGIESGAKTLKVFTLLGSGSGGSSFNAGSEAEWKAACSTITNGDSNQSYTINVTGDFSAAGAPYTNTFGKVTGITVTITGNNTITVSGKGSLVNITSGQTVNLKGVHLKGNSDNQHSLVSIYDAGTFNMESGSISNNTSIMGGGVYGAGTSTFNMTGGSISGNTAQYGGGVYLGSSATFKMTGGSISGNTATKVGGGAGLGGTSTFDLKNLSMLKNNTAGEGYGNELSVLVNATFKIDGKAPDPSFWDGVNYNKYK